MATGLFAIGIPIAELVVAVLVLFGATRIAGAWGALGLLAVFSVAIAVHLARGTAPDCHCFGQLHAAPVGWKTLARNGVLAGIAATALVAGLAGETASPWAWTRNLGPAGLVAVSLGAALIVLSTAGAMAVVSLLRSHGKVLLKLDDLERRLAAAGLHAAPDDGRASKAGLAPGTIAPAFSTNDANGTAVSLPELLAPARPLLLVFTSSTCGPCKALRPEIDEWQRAYAGRLTIAVLSTDTNLAWLEAYHVTGTPSAVVIAPDGRIASYAASGDVEMRALVTRTLAEPPAPARGLPLGAAVPDLRVPGLDGETVPLTRTGQETLVLFWNPHCGYCHSMRDDLLAWEQRAPAGAPRLLIVSSGDEASTRADGFASTVALDPEFNAGAIFGASATPMAILVDGQGRVASPLAAGAKEVFTLAGRGRASHA